MNGSRYAYVREIPSILSAAEHRLGLPAGVEPVTREETYLLVGGGRMARHMAHYLGILGVAHRSWTRGMEEESLAEGARGARAVLLLIPDGALAAFVDGHAAALGGAPLVHFSGSARVEGVQCCHPLGSFGATLHPGSVYRRITFVCDPGPRSFPDLFPGLPNPHVVMKPELRPLHHALAVLSGNFTVLLWQKALREWGRLGVPREAGLAYLETVAANLSADAAGALTGPLARGDRETVQANLAALGNDPWAAVYRAVVAAVEAGGNDSREGP